MSRAASRRPERRISTPDAYLLTPATAAGLQRLLARPDGLDAARKGGHQPAAAPCAVLEVGTLIAASPRPHYLAKVVRAPGVGPFTPASGNDVVVACLDDMGDLVPGQLVNGSQFGIFDNKPVFWTELHKRCEPDVTALVGLTVDCSGAAVVIKLQRKRFDCDSKKDFTPSDLSVTLPTTCVDVVTGATIACVNGAAVLTMTTTKVRVLACGAC